MKFFKFVSLLTMLFVVNVFAGVTPTVELGTWHCIGPFKDEAFGNLIRSLEFAFEPEKDYYRMLGIDPELVSSDSNINLALSAKALSPDGIAEDGPHYPKHAIDGNRSSYWDDVDKAKLYILRLDWEEPTELNYITLTGYVNNSFSPKTFDVVADDKVIKSVIDAVYINNQTEVCLPDVTCRQLELKITGYYGRSPAIREIGVYNYPGGRKKYDPSVATAIDTGKTYRMLKFPGYLDLDRNWQAKPQWVDGYYHLLPRGPAPSRNESVYLYRKITAEEAQRIAVNFRFMDSYKIWVNGRLIRTAGIKNRYPGLSGTLIDLRKGINHLLIKNTSRWAEHGFSFMVHGLNERGDRHYWDIRKHNLDTVENALAYLKSFKFQPTPIPMYSPPKYKLDEAIDKQPPSQAAADYQQILTMWQKKTETLLGKTKENKASNEEIIKHARDLYAWLEDQVKSFGPIIYIKHPPLRYNAIAPASSRGARPSSICRFDPATGVESVIFQRKGMAIFDMNLSWDAKSILFSARDKADWDIYRVNIDGSDLRQLTSDKGADISPCELADGRIVFISTRRGTYVICQGHKASLMYTMNADGSDVKLISANIDSDHRPQIMNDGRIMFTRWDYGIEKNVFARHALWSVNPDGTNMQLVFGNTIEDPGAFWNAKAIPGRSELIAVLGPHHSHHGGMIGLVWNGAGTEAPRGHGYRWVTREYPVWGDRTYSNGYQDPSVINEKQFLVSYSVPDAKSQLKTGIYYLDVYGNEALINQDESGLALYNPIQLKARQKPVAIPVKTNDNPFAYFEPEEANRLNKDFENKGTLLVQDVYKGISKYVKRGQAKYIAVMEQVQKSRRMAGGEAWGHTPIIGRGTVHARRLVGLVPIEEDGSAHFQVPAHRSLSLNVLNAEGKTLMRMGSDMHVMPGEFTSCIGCHEVREGSNAMAPNPSRFPLAAKSKPVVPEPPAQWKTAGLIDYIQVVQPVWDKHCLSCHSGPTPEGNVNMTSDRTRFFCQSYEHLVERDIVDHLSVFALDHDEGTPKTTGAIISTIDKYMSPEHCQSDISWDEKLRVYVWIDANVPYYGTNRYTTVRGVGARDSWEANNKNVTWSKSITQTFKQNCMSCHERKVFNQSWWPHPAYVTVSSRIWGDKAITSHVFPDRWRPVGVIGPELRINLTNPEHSLMLQGPLSKEAGGIGLCVKEDGSAVFKDKSDPAYQSILKDIEQGKARLEETPRIDMLGLEALLDEKCSTGDN